VTLRSGLQGWGRRGRGVGSFIFAGCGAGWLRCWLWAPGELPDAHVFTSRAVGATRLCLS